jgi:hypothetical protein
MEHHIDKRQLYGRKAVCFELGHPWGVAGKVVEFNTSIHERNNMSIPDDNIDSVDDALLEAL